MSSPDTISPADASWRGELPQPEEVRRLALRQREQLHLTRHLHLTRLRQQERERHLARLVEEADEKLRQFRAEHAAWLAEKAALEQALAGEIEAIAGREQALQQGVADLERRNAEFEQRPKPSDRGQEDVQALRQETEHLRKLLIARNREIAKAAEEQIQETAAFDQHKQQLRVEIDVLTQRLHDQTRAVEELRAEATIPAKSLHTEELAALRSQVSELSKLLAERDRQVEALQAMPRPAAVAQPDAIDFTTYETDLNEFRRQLEADRVELDEQLEYLQSRQSDLEGAAREAEVEMSRERATISRERAQLDRMREEIRVEVERLQREGGARAALGAVNKLAEEMSARRTGRGETTAVRPKPTAGSADGTKAVSGRGLRGRLGDV